MWKHKSKSLYQYKNYFFDSEVFHFIKMYLIDREQLSVDVSVVIIIQFVDSIQKGRNFLVFWQTLHIFISQDR